MRRVFGVIQLVLLFLLLPAVSADDGPEVLDVTGEAPSADKMDAVVREGMKHLLAKQRDDGSWEVALDGEMLSETADEAVDAVAVTALCGLALRKNADLMPKEVDAATRKAFDFMMKRILQGKLSKNVYYAVWRYNFGLRFLTAEYAATEDEAYREKIKVLATRMVQALVDMQLMADETRPRVGGSFGKRKKHLRPARMGMLVAMPTEEDYLGGARIVKVGKGSAAETSGLKRGDRIVKVEGERIENGYDFTMLETLFLGGENIAIAYTREVDGELQKLETTVKLEATWPGSLGLITASVRNKVTIQGFTQWSPAEKKGLQKGDRILEVHKTTVIDELSMLQALQNVRMGRKVKVKYERDGKTKSTSITCVPAPYGDLGLMPETEDKTGLHGVVIKEIKNQWTPLGRAGLQKGDRILKINGYRILGLDHYLSMKQTFPAGVPLIVHYKRDKDLKTTMVVPNIRVFGSRIEVSWDNDSNDAVLDDVDRNTATWSAGFRKGDKIVSIRFNNRGYPVNTKADVVGILAQIPAGSEVRFSVQRKNKLLKFTIDETPKATSSSSVKEVGGWNYYPFGAATSFVTASTLIALEEAEDAMGRSVRAPNVTLESAVKLIKSMKTKDEVNEAEGFMYARAAKDVDIRGQMGRIAVCELSLVVYGDSGNKSLESTIKTWLKHRHELDRVRNYEHTHNRALYNNAAYYWMFGHYYSCKAARLLSRGVRDEVLGKTAIALVKRQHPKRGTWLGHPAFGELCGTAQALMVFGEIRAEK